MRCGWSSRNTTLLLAFAGYGAFAQQIVPSPVVPAPSVTHIIRTRGDRPMRRTMQAWESAFRRRHPDVHFEDTLLGSATGMAGITTGSSDLALLGRPVKPNEVIGFEWVWRVKPLGVAIARGSLQAEEHSPALAVLVPRDNPMQSVRMSQLANLLGCPSDVTQSVTWSLVGATGSWSTRPVHVYLPDNQSGTGAFLMQTLQGSKDCWNWSIVHEFADQMEAPRHTATHQIAEALAHDSDGLAIATLAEVDSRIKALPVARSEPAVSLTPATITDGSYPLARNVYIYLRKPKDAPIDLLLVEFLRFALSPEGQAIVDRTGDFLPLSAEAASVEGEKIY